MTFFERVTVLCSVFESPTIGHLRRQLFDTSSHSVLSEHGIAQVIFYLLSHEQAGQLQRQNVVW